MSSGIFDFINSILYKTKLSDDVNVASSDYSQYMVNRWLSMYSNDVAHIINCTTNKFCNSMSNEEHYNLLFSLIPKCKGKRLEYLKKEKIQEKEYEDYNIDNIAYNMELSKKEIKAMLDSIENMNK